jgi:hypothetical protein
MRRRRRSKGAVSAATKVALTLAIGACGGKSWTAPSDAGLPSDSAATEPLGDGGSPEADASDDFDAASNLDATVDADASSDAGDAGNACSSDGGLAVTGDYVAADGTHYWLRQSATATTFTVVPGGTPSNTAPPHLARIREMCPQWLGAAGTDGTFARVDWASVDGGLLLCQRGAASLGAAAALSGADPNDVDAGCGGNAWISVTRVSP